MAKDYKVEITEISNPNLSKIQRVMLKTDPGQKLDDFNNLVLEEITGYAKLHVTNPSVKATPEYDHFVVMTSAGNFYTGSPSFMEAFLSIWSEMEGETGWGLEVYKRDSKNFAGKQFLTCRLVELK